MILEPPKPRYVLSPHTLRHATPTGCSRSFSVPQKVARQFDGNVVFSRYLTAIFAAFNRTHSECCRFWREFAPVVEDRQRGLKGYLAATSPAQPFVPPCFPLSSSHSRLCAFSRLHSCASI